MGSVTGVYSVNSCFVYTQKVSIIPILSVLIDQPGDRPACTICGVFMSQCLYWQGQVFPDDCQGIQAWGLVGEGRHITRMGICTCCGLDEWWSLRLPPSDPPYFEDAFRSCAARGFENDFLRERIWKIYLRKRNYMNEYECQFK